MTTPIPTPNPPCTTSRGNLLAAVLVVGLGTLALGAQPADAGNEFKHAFKDEFGRIVAHQVAAVSTAVLLGPVAVPRYESYPAPYFYGRSVPEYRHHARPQHRYRRHHGHAGHGRGHGRGHYRGKGHRHHRSCGHSYRSETRVERSRHGGKRRRGRYDY